MCAMPFEYLLTSIWRWLADSGLNIAILIVIAFLVPRAGRLITRVLERRVEADSDKEEAKSKLALAGVGVYVAQLVAFFIITVLILQQFGFSLAGAAIPATVVSAAVGFGAQSIIADFLAGLFVLSEKQYGVGDWVAFTGNGVDVEGTVIQITMRSTQIRTIDQSTVNIPNSTARVAINRSNYWSRAVVVMPVPLLGSASAAEALQRSEAATRRALAREDIAPEVIGDLDVHPAVSVDPPATVGMPWTVDMRFMIQVKAGSQWLVERAIRMSILDEFWDEYGSATTVDGTLIHQATTSDTPVSRSSLHDETPTEHLQETPENKNEAQPATEATKATEALSAAAHVPTEFVTKDGHDPAAVDASSDRKGQEAQDNTPAKHRSTLHDVFTAGRRMRPSTAVLLLVLFVLLVLRGLTASGTYNDELVSGILAPPPVSPSPTSELDSEPTGVPTTSQPYPEPSPTTEPGEPTTAPDYGETPTGESTRQYAPDAQNNTPSPQDPNQQPAQEPYTPTQQQTQAPATTAQNSLQEPTFTAPTTAPAQTANPVS